MSHGLVRVRLLATSSSLLAVFIAALFGCASAPPPPDREAQERALVATAQRLACLMPAAEQGCVAGPTARFEQPESFQYGEVRSITIRCEDGQPHAHIVTRSREIDGPFGQAVHEAIWRALRATGGCARMGGSPSSPVVTVTGLPSSASPHACVEPRVDLGDLFSLVYSETRQGPPGTRHDTYAASSDGPASDEGYVGGSICEIDPEACPSSPSPCPRFDGDPWNGVVAVPKNATKSAASSAPVSSGVPSNTATPRKPTYPETFCPDGTIADGNAGDLECRCCKPFGIPCPDSSVIAPRPEGHCTVFGSEDKSCLWKCE
ncbi:MAG: hypothetical protein U0441_28515 [Polyangiaceae bacterium]